MIVVAGPTASGKTELSVALAERLGGEIISADSRQIYRGLDAAAAKPSLDQRRRARHWLLDVVEPGEAYDAGRFAAEAAVAIADIRGRGRLPIICGGTGLYLRALLEGLAPLPRRDPALRARLAALAASEGRGALHERLRRADPRAAAAIPPGNLQRVTRALEVIELAGRPISELWAQGRAHGEPAGLILRLDIDPAQLRQRIAQRAETIWPNILSEVRALVPSRWTGREPGFSGLGYREALEVLAGRLGPQEGLAALINATNAYAKRQRTWFKNQLQNAVEISAASSDKALSAALHAWEKAHETSAA